LGEIVRAKRKTGRRKYEKEILRCSHEDIENIIDGLFSLS
jgi:hypothetical protein